MRILGFYENNIWTNYSWQELNVYSISPPNQAMILLNHVMYFGVHMILFSLILIIIYATVPMAYFNVYTFMSMDVNPIKTI